MGVGVAGVEPDELGEVVWICCSWRADGDGWCRIVGIGEALGEEGGEDISVGR